MKRLLFLAVLLALALAPVAPAETVHNLLQQNNRALAPYDLSVIPELLRSNANVFFVDNEATNASDAADGLHGETPELPFKTYDYAIGRCTAGQNNIIVLLPYSVERYTGAGSVDVDVTGITTIGLGYGPARPKFVFDNAAATFIVGRDGDGATFQNLTFQASVTGVTVGVQIEDGADNISCVDCEWLNGELAGTDEFVTAVDVVTEANDLSFERCRWTSVAAGATACIDIGDGAVARLTIKDCTLYGDYATACLFSDQANTGVILENTVFLDSNGDEFGIEFQGADNRGVVRGCSFITSGNYVDMGGLQDGGGNKTAEYAGDSDSISYGSFTFEDAGLTAAKLDADAITAAKVAADVATEFWSESVSAYSGAGYAGTYLKTLYADWLNGGRLDLLLDAITGHATYGLSAINTKIDAIQADTAAADTAGELQTLAGTAAISTTGISSAPTASTLADTLHKDGNFTYDNTTNSLEAISDKVTAVDDYVDTEIVALMKYLIDGTGSGATSGASLPAGKSLFDIIGDEYTDDGGNDNKDSVAAHLNLLSKYVADGDGDFATGTVLPANKSLYDTMKYGYYLTTGAAADADLTNYCADGSVLSHIMTKGADTSDYAASTDSLEALSDKVGAFSGDGGAAQDDSAKASLDLAHTDLDALLYWQEKTISKAATSTTDDLFDVAGGGILIKNFFGVVTTNIGAAQNQIKITLDADAGWVDRDFSTQVDLNGDTAGTFYVFTNANPSVLTPLTGGSAGSSALMSPWICGEGMIETANADGGTTGAITWYMTYVPLKTGVTVTAQ